jgi:hypothetical protein
MKAALAAINAMLAGVPGEGDWPKDISGDDLNSARIRLISDLDKRHPQWRLRKD